MPRTRRALSVFTVSIVTAGGLALAPAPAQAAPSPAGAERGLLDLLDFLQAPPQLSGDPLGGLLTATAPVWEALPLPNLLSTDVTWLCNGVPIPGATGWSFLPTEAQAGCLVTAQTVTTVVGTLVAPVQLLTNALQLPGLGESAVTPAGAPTVRAGSGGPKVGTVLTASEPEWRQDGVTTTYQWLRDGEPIAGRTGQSYTLVAADLDRAVSVRATGRKDGLTDGAVTSNALTTVLGDAPVPTTQPSIGGSGKVGQPLSVNPGSWGTGETPTYSYQWRRDNIALTGATAATYTPSTDDIGRVLTVTVTATRPGHRPGTFRTAGVTVPRLTSTLTATVARKTLTPTQKATMTLLLAIPGVDNPTGTITILDGTKVLRTVKVTPAKEGRVKVALGRLTAGTHRLRATYAGSDLASDAASKVVKVTVTKGKKK